MALPPAHSPEFIEWRYPNTVLLIASLIVFVVLLYTPGVQHAIVWLGSLGYVGGFICGIFFVSTFSVAPAAVILFHLAETLNPLGIALAAGLGSVLGDLLIFRFLRDGVFEELAPILRTSRMGLRFEQLFNKPYFAWIVPIIGALIIASPLPDEVGIGLMGLSKIRLWQFALVAFLLNTIGILLIALTAQSV